MQASKQQKKIAEAIQEIRIQGAKISKEKAKLRAVRQRADELTTTIRGLAKELRAALQNANSEAPEDVYQVVQVAKTLRAAIDEPVIPPDTEKAGR